MPSVLEPDIDIGIDAAGGLWAVARNSRLPNFSASPTRSSVNDSVHPLLRLLAFVWLALGMSVPVSAWTVHDAAHGAAQVSVDTHHHHDDDGGISVHDHDDGDAPDGGHDHMPCMLLGAVALPDTGFAIAAPLVERAIFAILPSRGIARHASDGLRRPPRLA